MDEAFQRRVYTDPGTLGALVAGRASIRDKGNPGQALKPWTARAKEGISNIL